jgi:hypothetical protein
MLILLCNCMVVSQFTDMKLTKAERWNGVLPTTMVPGSAVPFIEVSPGK